MEFDISGKKYCILIGGFDATFFQSLTRLYCIPALISEAKFCLTDLKVRFWYATMNTWIQLWVQGEMCGNNTIKLEWHIYNVSFSLYINSIGKKIHTLPRCGLVTIQIVRYILCSINFWCGFVCQGVFFLTNAVFQWKAVDFTLALLYLNFKLQYLMNYSSDFNNFCRFQLLAVCTTQL